MVLLSWVILLCGFITTNDPFSHVRSNLQIVSSCIFFFLLLIKFLSAWTFSTMALWWFLLPYLLLCLVSFVVFCPWVDWVRLQSYFLCCYFLLIFFFINKQCWSDHLPLAWMSSNFLIPCSILDTNSSCVSWIFFNTVSSISCSLLPPEKLALTF